MVVWEIGSSIILLIEMNGFVECFGMFVGIVNLWCIYVYVVDVGIGKGIFLWYCCKIWFVFDIEDVFWMKIGIGFMNSGSYCNIQIIVFVVQVVERKNMNVVIVYGIGQYIVVIEFCVKVFWYDVDVDCIDIVWDWYIWICLQCFQCVWFRVGVFDELGKLVFDVFIDCVLDEFLCCMFYDVCIVIIKV